MINGIKHRVVRLEQKRPDPETGAAMLARIERARARARANGRDVFPELTDERRAELRGKSIAEILMMGRQRAAGD